MSYNGPHPLLSVHASMQEKACILVSAERSSAAARWVEALVSRGASVSAVSSVWTAIAELAALNRLTGRGVLMAGPEAAVMVLVHPRQLSGAFEFVLMMEERFPGVMLWAVEGAGAGRAIPVTSEVAELWEHQPDETGQARETPPLRLTNGDRGEVEAPLPGDVERVLRPPGSR